MSKDQGPSNHREDNTAFSGIIPAFLSPRHILHHANDHIIDHSRVTDIEPIEENRLSDMIIREKLYNAMDNNDLNIFMQPIVTLPQRHSVFYELYGRLHIKSGVYVTAQKYLPLIHGESIVQRLDTVLLMRAIKTLIQHYKKVNRPISYFINITPATLRNHIFMKNLLGVLSKNRNIAPALVFEMQYNEFMMLAPGELKILDGLTQIGCIFSLDHVEDIPTDIRHLKEHNIRFLKISSPVITQYCRSDTGFSELLSRKHRLEVNNIDLIVEKVENEKSLLQILDLDLKYGQGFLFGKPDFQSVYTR